MRAISQEELGFTLIEMTVVLAIIAALGTITYAYFIPLKARVEVAFQRDDLERQLLELPQHVRISGRGGILASLSGSPLVDGTEIAIQGVERAGNGVEEWQVLRLDLPARWRLSVPSPIFYHFSGACDGGEVVFALPPVALRYVLTPPLCRPILVDEEAAK